MRINRYQLHDGKLPLLSIYMAGVLVGILIMNLGKSILLTDTGLLDEYTLYHMKYMTMDSSALFYYVLRLRIETFVMLVILATTYLGMVICVGTAFGYGLSTGAFVSALLVRYGLKGIVFAVLSVFPQYLLYIPSMTALLLWCERLNRNIYFKSGLILENNGPMPTPKRIVQLLVILGGILLGCVAESFMNPKVMEWLLNFF